MLLLLEEPPKSESAAPLPARTQSDETGRTPCPQVARPPQAPAPIPSPVATSGFVVSLYTCPAPPDAIRTERALIRLRVWLSPPSALAEASSAPTTRPSSTSSFVTIVHSANWMRGCAWAYATSDRLISAPVASPFAWSMRGRECAPSLVLSNLPASRVKMRTPFNQLCNALGPFADKRSCCRFEYEPVARGNGVFQMKFDVCLIFLGGDSNTTLRIVGIRFPQRFFRDHQNLAVIRKVNRSAQSRNARAHHQEVHRRHSKHHFRGYHSPQNTNEARRSRYALHSIRMEVACKPYE